MKTDYGDAELNSRLQLHVDNGDGAFNLKVKVGICRARLKIPTNAIPHVGVLGTDHMFQSGGVHRGQHTFSFFMKTVVILPCC